MEEKKLAIIAGGIIIAILVALAAAFVVLNNSGSPQATPTPSPAATQKPGAGTSTATPGTTAEPTGVASPTQAPEGPIIVLTNYNRTMSACIVSIFLNAGASPIDTGSMKIDVVSAGQTYRGVWTPKPADWAGSDGDAMLDQNEAIAAQIDTKALGIPQGQPITIKIMLDGAVLHEVTATPT